TNGVQDQIYSLPPPGLAGCNAVIAEVPNHGTIQHPLFGVDIRDVRYPATSRCVFPSAGIALISGSNA
ncbi:hypothetical protein, partial [Lawsonibacter sp.]|uniref:hypothetical protein n=1 Tax=Lawsonibacter sp. TaxID=2185275 RepID=UPI002582A9D7